MRIAIANRNRRRVGGAETYVNQSILLLHNLGHELLSLTEVDEPPSYDQIALPNGVAGMCVAEMGRDAALLALQEWRPDVVYAHGIQDVSLERDIIRIAPSIFFVHTFTGTCISGQKTFKSPVVKPCSRQFGWKCLLHYYPHRCGGLNPFTMWESYLSQAKRLENLRQYDAIVTHSTYMFNECVKHGIDPGRVHKLSDYERNDCSDSAQTSEESHTDDSALSSSRSKFTGDAPLSRLLYIGRMEFLKGGEVLLDALHDAQTQLGRPLHVTFAGDGRDRLKWEAKASDVQSRHPELSIEFVGWLTGAQLEALLVNSDLLVLPSLWPEPFGLVGLEAGKLGVPVAAFAVGGIPDWLFAGVNGYLAPGETPTAAGLADAIVNCLQNPAHHAQLRRGAMDVSRRLDMGTDMGALLKVLEQFEKAQGS
jgi:glycosyltransferase involved in cell wall biosynthesis